MAMTVGSPCSTLTGWPARAVSNRQAALAGSTTTQIGHWSPSTMARCPPTAAAKPPTPAGVVVADQVRLTDVAPTILEALGLPSLRGALPGGPFRLADYAAEKPVLDLRTYFNGPLVAHGIFSLAGHFIDIDADRGGAGPQKLRPRQTEGDQQDVLHTGVERRGHRVRRAASKRR